MKEWRYLVFLVKYHLNRWIREKKQGGVFYIGGSDVFPPPLKPEEELVLLEQLGGEEDVTVKSVLIERLRWIKKLSWQPMLHAVSKMKF